MWYDRGLKHKNMYHDILTEQWRSSVFWGLACFVYEDAKKLTRLVAWKVAQLKPNTASAELGNLYTKTKCI